MHARSSRLLPTPASSKTPYLPNNLFSQHWIPASFPPLDFPKHTAQLHSVPPFYIARRPSPVHPIKSSYALVRISTANYDESTLKIINEIEQDLAIKNETIKNHCHLARATPIDLIIIQGFVSGYSPSDIRRTSHDADLGTRFAPIKNLPRNSISPQTGLTIDLGFSNRDTPPDHSPYFSEIHLVFPILIF